MEVPLHQLSPTTRFENRAADYALFRPSYPAAAIDLALAGLPPAGGLVAADVGAGTGIASRLFAARGLRVFAVEPNPAMRDAAEPHPGVTFVEGTAEATGLQSGSVDLVLSAQAFHWFRPAEALTEFRRIVKPQGRLLFLANERDHDDPAMHAYNTAIRAAAERELSEGLSQAIVDALRQDGRSVEPAVFPYTQTLSRQGLVGRARSASYVPKSGPRYDQLLLDLDRIWREQRDVDGLVTLRYRTLVWRVDLQPGTPTVRR